MRGRWDASIIDVDHGQFGSFTEVLEESEIHNKLNSCLFGNTWLEWEVAREVLKEEVEGHNLDDDEEVGSILRENGWEVLYTYPSQ